jgi:LysM repeat protein
MIKLTSLLKEQRYKYKWLELLDYNVPKDAVTGYRLNMKERGNEAEIDESDLKYFLDDTRFASKYKNKNYVFWVEEKRGGRKRRVYIVYVYSTSNLPANIQIYLNDKTTPHYSLSGAPVYFSLKAEREGGFLKGADSAEAIAAAKEQKLKAAAAAAAAAEVKVDAEPTDTKIKTSIYKVVSGDTLAKIAKKHGITLNDIIQLNPQIQDPKKIIVGQSINVSGEAGIGPEVKDVGPEVKDVAPETNSGDRITAGYKISQRIQKIAKDLYDAANEGIWLPGTNEKLFDSAFDQIKSKSDVHGVDLEIARLEANSKKNLEAYINSEFSWNDKDIRLEKLAKLVGKREDGEIVKTPTSLMQQAAAEGKQESLANRKLPGQGFPTGPKV